MLPPLRLVARPLSGLFRASTPLEASTAVVINHPGCRFLPLEAPTFEVTLRNVIADDGQKLLSYGDRVEPCH